MGEGEKGAERTMRLRSTRSILLLQAASLDHCNLRFLGGKETIIPWHWKVSLNLCPEPFCHLLTKKQIND